MKHPKKQTGYVEFVLFIPSYKIWVLQIIQIDDGPNFKAEVRQEPGVMTYLSLKLKDQHSPGQRGALQHFDFCNETVADRSGFVPTIPGRGTEDTGQVT